MAAGDVSVLTFVANNPAIRPPTGITWWVLWLERHGVAIEPSSNTTFNVSGNAINYSPSSAGISGPFVVTRSNYAIVNTNSTGITVVAVMEV